MRRMFSENELKNLIAQEASKIAEEIAEEKTSLQYLIEHAVDITGLPASGSMEVETYANVINNAVKSKCVKLGTAYHFITYFIEGETAIQWRGGFYSDAAGDIGTINLIQIYVNKPDKTYSITNEEY